MKTKLSLALAAVFAAVIVYALFFRVSDEDRIRQKLGLLEEATKSRGPARPQRVQQAFARALTPRVHVDVAARGADEMSRREGARDFTREELALLISSDQEVIHDLDVELTRVHLDLDPAAQPPRADVDALATVVGLDLGDTMRRREIYQVTIHLEKIEGDWRISRVAAAPTY